jgi:hypothetical protein
VARSIAEQSPGFDDPFHLPVKQDDDALLLRAAVILDEAQARKERFVQHSQAGTFVDELQELVDRFGEAVRVYASAQERRSVATKGMNAAVIAGLAAFRRLDGIVPYKLGHDSDALALWEQARKMEFPSRRRYVAPLMPAVVPTPPAGVTPAPPEETASTSPPVSTATPANVEADADQPPADIPLPKAS